MYADEQKITSSSRTDIDNDRWSHDMFDANEAPPAKQLFTRRENNRRNERNSGAIPRRQPERAPVQNSTAVLMVSNLASSILLEDLEELFEPFAPKAINLHHDSTGKSVGSATVEVTQTQAAEIIKKFQNAELDDKELVFNLVNSSAGQSKPRPSIHSRLTRANDDGVERGGDRRFTNRRSPTQSKFKHSGHRGGSRNDGHDDRVGGGSRHNDRGSFPEKNRRGGEKKKRMTEAELDAELEEYMKH